MLYITVGLAWAPKGGPSTCLGRRASSLKDKVMAAAGRRGKGGGSECLKDSVCTAYGLGAVPAGQVQGLVLTVSAVRQARQEPEMHGLIVQARV